MELTKVRRGPILTVVAGPFHVSPPSNSCPQVAALISSPALSFPLRDISGGIKRAIEDKREKGKELEEEEDRLPSMAVGALGHRDIGVALRCSP